MCARWPTIAMSKLFFWFERSFCRCMAVMSCVFGVMCLWFDLLSSDVASCEVICGTTPVLLCTTKNYNVLLQYYSNVLLQNYSVLQSTTPVLLCTTKYYASTTLYYTVLLQYYSVLQSTTTYYSGTTLKRHLQCVEQVKSPSNLTKYCACHAKWTSSMICVTYETSFPMRGGSKVTRRPHQILRLPRKMQVINDLRHIWNLISNAWRQ